MPSRPLKCHLSISIATFRNQKWNECLLATLFEYLNRFGLIFSNMIKKLPIEMCYNGFDLTSSYRVQVSLSWLCLSVILEFFSAIPTTECRLKGTSEGYMCFLWDKSPSLFVLLCCTQFTTFDVLNKALQKMKPFMADIHQNEYCLLVWPCVFHIYNMNIGLCLLVMFAMLPICIQDSIFKMSSARPDYIYGNHKITFITLWQQLSNMNVI